MAISYKKAVVNMCKSCIYDPLQKGTWVQQVRECTSSMCPLFNVRPGVKREPTRTISEEHKRKLQIARKS